MESDKLSESSFSKKYTECNQSYNPNTCHGEFKTCSECLEVYCEYHMQTMAHVPYGCPCPKCGERYWTDCPHRNWTPINVKDSGITIQGSKVTEITGRSKTNFDD